MIPDAFIRALDGFESVLAGVTPGRWATPSPCAGWSAADVAGHVVGNLQATEAFATGRDDGDRDAHPISAVGDDPLATWRAARADMIAVLDSRALAKMVPSPTGLMTLAEFLTSCPMEFLVHAWDLAQATGQVAELDAGLVRDALEPARRFAPMARLVGMIGPECPVAQDSDDLTRLLGIFGRRNVRQ